MSRFFHAAILALPLVAAQLVPTGPSPGAVFKEGGDCVAEWTPDTTGAWKVTNIELMTGPNNPMVHLSTVGTIDGTDPAVTSFKFKCPVVDLHSAVYFLQFTAAGEGNVQWTGRWAITAGAAPVPAPNTEIGPTGDKILWGQAVLAVSGTPPPSTAPAGQIDGSSSDTVVSSVSGSASTSSTGSTGSSTTGTSTTSSLSRATTTTGTGSKGATSGFSTVTVSSGQIGTGTGTGTGTASGVGASGSAGGKPNSAVSMLGSPITVVLAAVFGAFIV